MYDRLLSCTVNDTQAEVFSESLVLETFPNNKKTVLFETAKKSHSPGLPTYFSPASYKNKKHISLNRSHCILAQAESLNIRKEVTEAVKILLGELQQICVFNPIPSHMRDYKPISDTLQLDASNIAGVLAGLDGPRLEEVHTKLTRYLKDIPEKDIKRVWAADIRTAPVS